MSVLAVEDLRVRLRTPAGDVTVVDGVDYEVEPGEVFGVAGESGSGKTISMLALLGLLPDGAVRRRDARASAATTCSQCRAGGCARSRAASSRWSSRIRSRRSTRCSRSGGS